MAFFKVDPLHLSPHRLPSVMAFMMACVSSYFIKRKFARSRGELIEQW